MRSRYEASLRSEARQAIAKMAAHATGEQVGLRLYWAQSARNEQEGASHMKEAEYKSEKFREHLALAYPKNKRLWDEVLEIMDDIANQTLQRKLEENARK